MRVNVKVRVTVIGRNTPGVQTVANVPTCAGHLADVFQRPMLSTVQRRTALLFIASFALQAARWVVNRRQLKIRRRLARVTGPALHASGELGVGPTLDICVRVCWRESVIKGAEELQPRDQKLLYLCQL